MYISTFNRKWFFIGQVALSLTLLMAWPGQVSATPVLTENLDDKNVGELNSQNGWVFPSGFTNSGIVITGFYLSPFNSLWFSDDVLAQGSEKTGTAREIGEFSFVFDFSASSTYTPSYGTIYLNQDETENPARIVLYCGGNRCDLNGAEVGLNNITICSALASEWNLVRIQFDETTEKVRGSCNQQGWSEWLDAYTGAFDYINKIKIIGSYFGVGFEFYLDDLGEGTPNQFCAEIESQGLCEATGCCWYFDEWLFVNKFYPYEFCISCQMGTCASEFESCKYCSEAECGEQEFCYWYDKTDECRYGTGHCGEGLELQLCDNKADCETNGGYWYDDFCFFYPKSELLDWEAYYDEHGDYATPSAWISGVASSTGGLLSKIGGFLGAFDENFDLNLAYSRGKELGSALPVARGYLAIIDDFLGGLPIGELLIFTFVLMLAVGTFRVIRNLVQLFKFW